MYVGFKERKLQVPSSSNADSAISAELGPVPPLNHAGEPIISLSGFKWLNTIASFSPIKADILHASLSPDSLSFDYNLNLPPTSDMLNDFGTRTNHIWAAPATYPTSNSMMVVCDQLPWALRIDPIRNGSYISVSDVLLGLHHSLRKNVKQDEFDTLSLQRRKVVSLAYQERCDALYNSVRYKVELSNGLKRIDFLTGRSKFSGIKPGKKGEWVLVIASDNAHGSAKDMKSTIP